MKKLIILTAILSSSCKKEETTYHMRYEVTTTNNIAFNYSYVKDGSTITGSATKTATIKFDLKAPSYTELTATCDSNQWIKAQVFRNDEYQTQKEDKGKVFVKHQLN